MSLNISTDVIATQSITATRFFGDGSGLTNISGTGVQGTQGPQGIQGNVGVQGIQGPIGTQGIQGIQGLQGTVGGSAGRPYYFNKTDSAGVNSYWRATEFPSANGLSSTTINLTGTGNFLFNEFITDAGSPGVSTIPVGEGTFSIHASVTAGTAQVTVDTYKASSAGNSLVLISSTTSPSFANNTVTDITWSYVITSPISLLQTDRLVFRIYGSRVGGPSTVPLTIYYEDGQPSSVKTTISAGATGIQGSTGPQGIQGPQGTTGTQGLTGFQGIQGAIGATGPQGIQGIQGNTGIQGIQGTQGTQGSQGTTGLQGAQGIQGTQGTQGITGAQGTTGSQGTQGITGAQGIQGSQGTQGIQGSQGTTGSQGTQGIQGTQGTTGSQGATGIQGTTGSQGIQGIQGIAGAQGTTGTQGATGIQGTTGSQGITGTQGTTGSQGTQGIQGITGAGTQGIQGIQGITGATGPGTAINASNDTTTTALYPVMVGAAGSNQTPKVTTTVGYLTYDASNGNLTSNSLTLTQGNVGFNTSGSYGLVYGTASIKFAGQFEGIQVIPYNPQYVGFSVKGVSGQTEALQYWKNSSGSVLSKVNADGTFSAPTYYDSHNTNFLLDPTATTYLSNLNIGPGVTGGTRVLVNQNADYFSYYAAEATPRIQLGRDIGISGGAGIAFGGSSYTLLGTDDTGGTNFYIKLATTVGSITTSPNLTLTSSGLTLSSNLTVGGNITSNGNVTVGTNALGKNVVVNSTLGSELTPALTAGNWTGTNWSATGTTITHTTGSLGSISPVSAISITAGKVYKVVMTLTAGGGSYVNFSLGGKSYNISTAATQTWYVYTINTNNLSIGNLSNVDATTTISSITIKEVVASTGTLTVEGPATFNSTLAINNLGIGTPSSWTINAPLEVIDYGGNAIRVTRQSVPNQYLAIHTGAGGQFTIGAYAFGNDKSFVISTDATNQGIQFATGLTPTRKAEVAGDGTFYARNLYDIESTAYYVDPGATGTSANLAGSITVSGNAGIGTASPARKLEVKGGNVRIDNRSTGSQTASELEFLSGDTAGSWNTFKIVYTKSGATDRIEFTDGGGVNGLTIANGGNVTIAGSVTVGSGTSNFGGNVLQTAANDTSHIYHQIRTSGATGGGLFGVEGSTVGNLITGTTAYATVISSTSSGTDLQFGTSGVVRATMHRTNGSLTLNSSTASTSTTTGALVVSGGVGVAGAVNAGGNLTVSGGAVTLNNAAESYVELKVAGTTKGYIDQLASALNVIGMSGVDVDIYAGGNNPANRVAKFAASGIATTLYGNLTVSGTGTSSVAGNLQIGGTPNTAPATIDRYSSVNVANAADFPAFLLSVADGAKNVRGSMYIDASTNEEQWAWDFTYSSASYPQYKWKIAGTTLATLRDNGNLILSSTGTDNGNGKLQLATHTDKTGGIGFGTDVSFYRSNSDALTSYSSGTANNFFLRHSTTSAAGLQLQIDSSKDVYIFQRENRPMYLGTNNTTALTLDASQNATFAGTISQTQAAAGSTANLKLIESGIRDWGFYATGGKMSIRPSSIGTWSFNGNTDVELLRTTASTSTTTGALTVAGGVGVAGNVNAGGNLTVNGTGLSGVAGALNVTGALLAHQTAALNMAHEGSSVSQLVSYGADASTYGRLNINLRKAGTGVGQVIALALTSTDATLAGNFLSVSGGIINTYTTPASGIVGTRIVNPAGASYATTTSLVTGAWKITLPASRFKSNTMVMMTVRIYQYNTGKSLTFRIGGYNYSDVAANWYNIFAQQDSDIQQNAFTIRFGNDGSSNCIWIGETNSTWDYPQVFITDVQVGFSSADSAWSYGWAIAPVTAFDTVTQTRTASVLLNTNNVTTYGVSTVAGTANQVLVNGATTATSGAVTLSLPSAVSITNTLSVGNGQPTAAINIGGGANSGTQLNITSADGNNDYSVRIIQQATGSSNGLYIRTKGTRTTDYALYVASNDGANPIIIAKNDKTVSVGGDFTVSGGTITGGTSGLSLASGGANQNITLTPSGTGIVSLGLVSNTVQFSSGASNITPNLIIGSNGGKALALSAGSNGAGFAFDSSGYFAITYDTRANVIANGYGTTEALRVTGAGNVIINAATASSSTTTGALVVSGGVGVAGAGYFGGSLTVSGTTDASSAPTGSIYTAGGIAVGTNKKFMATGTGGYWGAAAASTLETLLIRATGFGYNPTSYAGVQIGGTTGRSIVFGVDVSAIAGGQFSGASNEWIIPNTLNIRQVTSAGTDFSNVIFSIGNGGATTIGGNLTVSGGLVTLNNATSNLIYYNTNGVAAPTANTRSAGTKIVLYDGLSASTVDYAIGINAGTLWNSVPSTTQTFSWYGGTTAVMSLSGSGNLTVNGTGTSSFAGQLSSTGAAEATGDLRFGHSAGGKKIRWASANYNIDLNQNSDTDDLRLRVAQFVVGSVAGFASNYVTLNSGSIFTTGNLTVSGGTTTLADSNGSFGTITGSYNAGNPFVRFNRVGSAEYIGLFADNSTRFVNNNAERARITSGGNFLLGTTTDMAGSGGLKIAGTTDSTSTTTGALQVAGGVGIAGAVNIGSTLSAKFEFSPSYTSDGVWSANARPSTFTGYNSNSTLLIGYSDDGGGSYYPSIGFKCSGDAFATSAAIIGSRYRTTAGVLDTADRFQIQAAGKILWGSGSAAQDVTLHRSAASTLAVTGNLSISGTATINGTEYVLAYATLTTTATTANQVITTLAAATYRTAKFVVQASDVTSGKYQSVEILAVHNGTTVAHTEFSAINVGGAAATYDVDISAGNIRLLCTPLSVNSTVFKVSMQLIKV